MGDRSFYLPNNIMRNLWLMYTKLKNFIKRLLLNPAAGQHIELDLIAKGVNWKVAVLSSPHDYNVQ